MVSFQCNGCGDVIKKPKLDTHRGRCHSSFDCIDCHTTFNNPGEYKGHTSCISEAEKYQKGLYKGPKHGQPGSAPATPAAAPRNNYPPPEPAAPMPQAFGRGNYGRPQRVSVTGANETPLGTPPPPPPSANGGAKVWGNGNANGNGNISGQSTPPVRAWGNKPEAAEVVSAEVPKVNGAAEKNDKKRKSTDVTTETPLSSKNVSEETSEKRKEKKAKKEKKAAAAIVSETEPAEKSEKKKSKKDKKTAATEGDEATAATSDGESHKTKKRKRGDDMQDIETATPAEPVKEKKKKDKSAAKVADAMDVDLPAAPPADKKQKKSSKKDKDPEVANGLVDAPAPSKDDAVSTKEARKREKKEKRTQRRIAEATAAEVAVSA